MMTRTIRILTTLALAGALAVLAGCAKKAVQAPPTPATPPPTTAPSTPTPTPTPTPAETAPATPASRVEDLKPAFFDLDSYSLSAEARAVLDADARVLRDNPTARVVIEGHCDERGTVEYNQALGERRAQAARDYLVNAGIDGARLSVISYGKERPFATGSDEAAWAQNRRAHFTAR
jgi:peptidoglycan-associated lipoprotein